MGGNPAAGTRPEGKPPLPRCVTSIAGAFTPVPRFLPACRSWLKFSTDDDEQVRLRMPLNAAAAVGKPPSARSGHSCTALPAHLSARLSLSGAEGGAKAEVGSGARAPAELSLPPAVPAELCDGTLECL